MELKKTKGCVSVTVFAQTRDGRVASSKGAGKRLRNEHFLFKFKGRPVFQFSTLQSLVAGTMGVQQAPRKVSPPHIYGPGPGPPGAIYDRPHTLRDYGQVSGLPFYQQQQSVLASQQFTTLRLLSVGSP